jgi:hypothetical protein
MRIEKIEWWDGSWIEKKKNKWERKHDATRSLSRGSSLRGETMTIPEQAASRETSRINSQQTQHVKLSD